MDKLETEKGRYNQAYIEWLETINKEQERHRQLLEGIRKDLRGVNNMLVFFVILTILGLIIQFFFG